MRIWKTRLLALLASAAMLLAVSGPAAMAQDLDDCVVIDGDLFCEVDDDFFFGHDDFFFNHNDDFFFEECLGAVIDGECFGIS